LAILASDVAAASVERFVDVQRLATVFVKSLISFLAIPSCHPNSAILAISSNESGI